VSTTSSSEPPAVRRRRSNPGVVKGRAANADVMERVRARQALLAAQGMGAGGGGGLGGGGGGGGARGGSGAPGGKITAASFARREAEATVAALRRRSAERALASEVDRRALFIPTTGTLNQHAPPLGMGGRKRPPKPQSSQQDYLVPEKGGL
jgi:hypothetical protein